MHTAARSFFHARILTAALLALLAAPALTAPEDRQALFGDTHVHSYLSFDAYIFGNRNGPDEAYRFAKGEAIDHPYGFPMQLGQKLDFLAVTDHAVYLGMVPAMFDETSAVSQHPLATGLREADGPLELRAAFARTLPYLGGLVEDDLLDMNIVRSAWQEIIAAGERHNDPGTFTTFIGYEFTISQQAFETLHRNVIFASGAPALPMSRLDSNDPEDLWRWMEELRADGMDSIAIPHNSNRSNGFMFRTLTRDGNPMDRAYSARRMRNEPIIELTQVKGTSETHPLLSPNDEHADFEIGPYVGSTWHLSNPDGSYARKALLDGMKLEASGRGNPFQFGFIGSSDSHVGAGSFREDDYWSKVGVLDATGQRRGSVPLPWTQRLGLWFFNLRTAIAAWLNPPPVDRGTPPDNPAPGYMQAQTSTWGASGLAAVWAEENTRESIFSAMRRKEVFATSGPRIRVRMFAGHRLNASLVDDVNMVRKAYARGVPMGGSLLGRGGQTPGFLLWAMRDPNSAPLQKLQVVKGWMDEAGEMREVVYDVACAGDERPDAATHRCVDNNAAVDTETCEYSADTGASELKTYWADPDFDDATDAFYYLRVLENPTCRWSTWDAVRAGTEPNPSLALTVQERAWSSPIWYQSPSN